MSRPERRWLVLAALTAGLAFACKYSGIFVLPIIAVAVARRPVTLNRPASNIAVLRATLLASGALLVASSFFFNPGWIAAHLTEDGHIDSQLPAHLLHLLTAATRGGGVLVILVAAAPWLWTWLRRWTHGLAVVWSWYLVAVTFVAAFVITSPYSFYRAAFIKGLLGEAAFAAPVSFAGQLAALQGIGLVVGWPAAIVAIFTIGILLWRARSPFTIAAVDAVLISWIAIYTVVLLLPAHELYLDYALPLVPVVAMLAGRGASALLRAVIDAAPSRRVLATAALVLAVVVAEVPLAADLLRERGKQRGRMNDSPQAYVATWLQCRAPSSARIAYDYFVYVPSTFPNAFVTWGGTEQWLASINPDIVIVEVATAGYAGETAEHQAYYTCLPAGTCGYERALARDDLVVYVRQGRRDQVLEEEPAQLSARGCS